MPRVSHKLPSGFVPFRSVGHRLGDTKKENMRPFKVQQINAPASKKSRTPKGASLLKPTTMGRIIGDHVVEVASSDQAQNGLEWWKKPARHTQQPWTTSSHAEDERYRHDHQS